jgi:DNA-binding MurR/RpiR family transcriptional regulator
MSTDKPTSLDGLRKLIGREGERLTPRMRDAARYAIDHPNDLALNPIAKVANLSGIPPAAFVRMAQALGFDGYADLQRLFREPLQRAAQPTFRERIRHYGGELTLENPRDPAEVLRAFSEANRVSLEHLRADSSVLPLKAAIKLIKQARMVHVLGLRRSFAVAAYLAYALNRVGQPTALLTGLGGTISEQASMVGPQDLLIAISFPPYAADTLKACEQIHKSGAKRLAITNACMSPIAKDADLVLEVNDAELRGFRSLTSAMCLAQTLAMSLAFMKQRGGTDDDSLNAELSDIDC